jgi:micrococcal nuclease
MNIKKIILNTLVILILLTYIILNKTQNVYVTYFSCIDGDTFKLIFEGEVKTIRLLAVDTPETVHPTKKDEYYGKESSDYTCNLIKNSKQIKLEFDNNSDLEDKYGRLLAWVFVDNELLQSKLVIGGYAKVAYLYAEYKYTDVLLKYQNDAKQKRLGIWLND